MVRWASWGALEGRKVTHYEDHLGLAATPSVFACGPTGLGRFRGSTLLSWTVPGCWSLPLRDSSMWASPGDEALRGTMTTMPWGMLRCPSPVEGPVMGVRQHLAAMASRPTDAPTASSMAWWLRGAVARPATRRTPPSAHQVEVTPSSGTRPASWRSRSVDGLAERKVRPDELFSTRRILGPQRPRSLAPMVRKSGEPGWRGHHRGTSHRRRATDYAPGTAADFQISHRVQATDAPPAIRPSRSTSWRLHRSG